MRHQYCIIKALQLLRQFQRYKIISACICSKLQLDCMLHHLIGSEESCISSTAEAESALCLSILHSWPEDWFADRYVNHELLSMLTNTENAIEHMTERPVNKCFQI